MKTMNQYEEMPLAHKEVMNGRVVTSVRTYNPLDQRSAAFKSSTLAFITRSHFNELTKLGVSALELSEVSSYCKLKSISDSTHARMVALNQKLHFFLMGITVFEDSLGLSKKDPIVQNAKSAVEHFLLSDQNYVDPSDKGEKYYEILPVGGDRQLIIVEGGFLKFLTQDKGNCVQFVLASLRAFNKFDTHNHALNSLYLKLLLVEPYYRMVCLRSGV